MKRVNVTPRQLRPMFRRLQRDVLAGCKNAMVEGAMFGTTAVAKTTASSKPRPRATGAFENSWKWRKTRKGAILGNTSPQSFFVERGRQPGKKPPLEPILEWVKLKKKFRTKKGSLRKAHAGGIKGRGSKARKLARRDQLERSAAFAIQAKIGRVGTKARWPLKRAMPAISKRTYKELGKAVKHALSRVG